MGLGQALWGSDSHFGGLDLHSGAGTKDPDLGQEFWTLLKQSGTWISNLGHGMDCREFWLRYLGHGLVI